MRMTQRFLAMLLGGIFPLALALVSQAAEQRSEEATQSVISSQPFLQAVRRFADRVLSDGRDKYGPERTPLFVDGLHAETLEPAKWICRGETWVLSNFANQQPLLRTLDGLTALTGLPQYRQAAEEATKYALTRLRTPNGLLYWGGHLAWDLEQEKAVGQYEDIHEQKNQQPYYELMWRVNSQRTAELIETIWAAHILDWSLFDYNRHGSIRKPLKPQWDHAFNDETEVPFAIKGGNLSFVCVTPSLLHASVTLAVLDKKTEALTWSERLIRRWQQGKDPRTGLCGGQLSYRQEDRARDALGHVHPTINEAKIVASYHQTGRYHQLPLAQMQAAVALMDAGGAYAEVGKEFLQWASDDLKTYAQQCYEPHTGRFVAKMTDGTPLQWQQARSGYYVAESFAPQKPDGCLFWGCATAYRLTKDRAHWRMLREIAKRLDLGDAGEPGGEGRSMNPSVAGNDWRFIYAMLELHRATEDQRFLAAACRIGENVLKMQTTTGLFPQPGRQYARTGDEAPLAILHLAAAIEGKRSVMPAPMFDHQFFHCEYQGELEKYQQKRDDKRTYDNLVFYGD
jgi:pectate lyase